LRKSRLFIAFSLPYFHSLISIPSAFYILSTYAHDQPLLAALSVASINFIARSIMFVVLYALTRKMVRLQIPWKNVVKYGFAGAVMGLTLYLIPHPTRASITLVETLFGGGLYLAVLFAIDKEARKLARGILREIINSLKRIISILKSARARSRLPCVRPSSPSEDILLFHSLTIRACAVFFQLLREIWKGLYLFE
jgi:hypothetical protein